MFRVHPDVYVDNTLPAAQALGGAATAGTSPKGARVDHQHALAALTTGDIPVLTTSHIPAPLTLAHIPSPLTTAHIPTPLTTAHIPLLTPAHIPVLTTAHIPAPLTTAHIPAPLTTAHIPVLTYAHLPIVPACRVYNSAAIAVPSGTGTRLTFNSERYDTDTMHSTSANTGRITAARAGIYHIYGAAGFDAASGGIRGLWFKFNGTTDIGDMFIPVSAGVLETDLAFGVDAVFAVGDYVELFAYQNSGGSINILAYGSYTPEFGVTYLGREA